MRTSTGILLGVLGLAIAALLYTRTRSGAAALQSATSSLGDAALAIGDYVGLSNRGLRDNNPGNIRRSGSAWLGKLSREDVESSGGTYDPDFEQFSSMQYGVRALGHLMLTYTNNYGLRSVRSLISRYAPSSENDTEDYIQEVSAALVVGSNDSIDVHSVLPQLVAAIMKRETGYYGDTQQITEWVYS